MQSHVPVGVLSPLTSAFPFLSALHHELSSMRLHSAVSSPNSNSTRVVTRADHEGLRGYVQPA